MRIILRKSGSDGGRLLEMILCLNGGNTIFISLIESGKIEKILFEMWQSIVLHLEIIGELFQWIEYLIKIPVIFCIVKNEQSEIVEIVVQKSSDSVRLLYIQSLIYDLWMSVQ